MTGGHGCAWRASELLADDGWRCAWSAELTEELLRSAPAAVGGEALALPPEAALAREFARLADLLEHGPGVVLRTGLPVGRWDAELAARVFWGLGCRLGTPVSQSATGARLFHVRDEGLAPEDPRFRGPSSNRRLRFHTDRCDVIAFLCLRSAARGGATYVASSEALYRELARQRPDLAAVLREPFPYLRHVVDPGNPRPFVSLPIVSFAEGRFGANLLRVLIERADRHPAAPDLTPVQREALDALDALAEDPAWHVRLELAPGDLLLLQNWTTLHRRSAFEDAGSPAERRHLLRLWLSMPNSRPIDPRFREHFGATASGALRGGIWPGPHPAEVAPGP